MFSNEFYLLIIRLSCAQKSHLPLQITTHHRQIKEKERLVLSIIYNTKSHNKKKWTSYVP